jgi:hypothetical protein
MARYQLAKTEVKRIDGTIDFNAKEIADYANARTLLEEPYSLLPVPYVQFKAVLSPHLDEQISFYSRKDMSDEEETACGLGDAEIIDMANEFWKDDEKRNIVKNLWIQDGKVLFVSGGNTAKVIEETLLDDIVQPTLSMLRDLSMEQRGMKISDYLIITEDNNVKHVSPNGMGKMFLPYMSDWFEAKFPSLSTSADDKESFNVTETGLKFLLKLFANEAYIQVKIEDETLPKEALFHISSKEFSKSILTNGLSADQLKTLSGLLKARDKRWNFTESYFDKDTITEIELDTPPYSVFCQVTWPMFFHHKNMFPVGCEILLAPRQVILDDENNVIFSADEVYKIYYKGPDAKTEKTQNTISVIVRGKSVEHSLGVRLKKYFKEHFDLPVQSISIIGKRKKETTL